MTLSENQREVMLQARVAKATFDALVQNPAWMKRYMDNDPRVLDQVDQLTRIQAAGRMVKDEVMHGPEMAADQAALDNINAQIADMVGSKAFAERVAKGELAAVTAEIEQATKDIADKTEKLEANFTAELTNPIDCAPYKKKDQPPPSPAPQTTQTAR